MPSDTGAPFFLPYPEDTDLVRDGASDIEALALAVASGLSAAGTDDASDLTTGTLAIARLANGTVRQVLSTIKTNAFTTASTSFVDVPGMSVTISPSLATSKILVLCDTKYAAQQTDGNLQGRLLRGATQIGLGHINRSAGTNNLVEASTTIVLDSPATTSATTYKWQVQTSEGVGGFNTGRANPASRTSSITVIEVTA